MKLLHSSPRTSLVLVFVFCTCLRFISAQIPGIIDCRGCCEDLFIGLTGNALADENLRLACNGGCNGASSLNCEALSPPACQVGKDFKATGSADTANVPDGNIGVVFCIEGGTVSESKAPTPNPTPPTRRPTKAPINRAPVPELGNDESQDSTPIVIGIASGGVIIGVILIILLIPKKKVKKGKNILDDQASKFDEMTVMTSATTVLPNIHDIRKQNPNRASMATLREQSLLEFNPLAPHREFEVVFDFVAEEEDELAVKEGQIVQGVHAVDNQWWVVQNEAGEMGMVPLNYMKEVFPDSPAAMVQVPITTTTPNDPDDIF